MTKMTFTEFAAHQKVSKAMVTKLKKQGRLVLVEESGKVFVNLEATQRLIANTTDYRRAGNGANAKAGAGMQSVSLAVGSEDLQAAIMKSRAHEAEYRALQTELDYRKQAGSLVEAEKVRLAMTNIGADLRQTLERLPDRLSDKLSLMSNPLEIHKHLTDELDLALMEIAKNAQRIGYEIEHNDNQDEEHNDAPFDSI